mgnify:CR=1 FL=1
MSITSAKYVGSFPDFSKCPKDNVPEYAFIGRSNVGKSSLINLLTQRKSLAKTSSTPGKTQMINYFFIDEAWYLVDLPGYGYAKLSKKHRASLKKMVQEYMKNRLQLVNAFVLIDSRIQPQQIDLDFVNFLGEHQVPFSLVFTKVDKQSNQKTMANIEAFKTEMRTSWQELPPIFPTSSIANVGGEALMEYIDGINGKLQAEQRNGN